MLAPSSFTLGRRARDIEERRQHVAQFHGLRGGRAPAVLHAHALRPADQHRDVRGGFVGIGLAPEVVVAGHVAVVGGEEDERVIEHAALFKRLQNKADLLVDEAD